VSSSFFDRPQHILCLGAHSDDIEIGALGTLLLLAQTNPEARLTFLVLTATPERSLEARVSANEAFGDRVEVHMGNFEDRVLPYDDPVAAKSFVYDAVTPTDVDIVFAPSLTDAHQDHRFAARLAQQVFRGPTILGYEIPKFDADLLPTNVYVRFDESIAHRKVEHLQTNFASQHGKLTYPVSEVGALMRIRGLEAASTSGYAEGFHSSKVILR
jgi:LmbE family N-acetylglucosaminyl deacetylase